MNDFSSTHHEICQAAVNSAVNPAVNSAVNPAVNRWTFNRISKVAAAAVSMVLPRAALDTVLAKA